MCELLIVKIVDLVMCASPKSHSPKFYRGREGKLTCIYQLTSAAVYYVGHYGTRDSEILINRPEF